MNNGRGWNDSLVGAAAGGITTGLSSNADGMGAYATAGGVGGFVGTFAGGLYSGRLSGYRLLSVPSIAGLAGIAGGLTEAALQEVLENFACEDNGCE